MSVCWYQSLTYLTEADLKSARASSWVLTIENERNAAGSTQHQLPPRICCVRSSTLELCPSASPRDLSYSLGGGPSLPIFKQPVSNSQNPAYSEQTSRLCLLLVMWLHGGTPSRGKLMSTSDPRTQSPSYHLLTRYGATWRRPSPPPHSAATNMLRFSFSISTVTAQVNTPAICTDTLLYNLRLWLVACHQNFHAKLAPAPHKPQVELQLSLRERKATEGLTPLEPYFCQGWYDPHEADYYVLRQVIYCTCGKWFVTLNCQVENRDTKVRSS